MNYDIISEMSFSHICACVNACVSLHYEQKKHKRKFFFYRRSICACISGYWVKPSKKSECHHEPTLPHTKASTLPYPHESVPQSGLHPLWLFRNGGERLLPCQSTWPLIGPSGYPQILFPDGGEIGPQRPGPLQTLRAWRPPLIFYLMEVL